MEPVRLANVTVAAAMALALAACTGDPPEHVPPPSITEQPAVRDQLAGIAATAKDRRYVATYTLTTPKRADRTITVALATDGTWVVAIPASGLSGLADLAIYAAGRTLYQCVLGPAAGTAGQRPDLGPITPGCVKTKLTGKTDPRVQHIFTDWIDPLIDRATALSVATATPLPGAEGTCYSVESNSAALTPPVDPGIYCYRADGVLTAARVGFGTLKLTGAVAAAPPSVTMPAPAVTRTPLPVIAPAPPKPSATPTGSASAKPPA